jgi:hypothetical protein
MLAMAIFVIAGDDELGGFGGGWRCGHVRNLPSPLKPATHFRINRSIACGCREKSCEHHRLMVSNL